MTERAAIPEGYEKIWFEDIGATALKPEDWFYMVERGGTEPAHHLTRESIEAGNAASQYQTGLQLLVVRRVSRRMLTLPSSKAETFMAPVAGFTPLDEASVETHRPFVTFKRSFVGDAGQLQSAEARGMMRAGGFEPRPIVTSFAVTANDIRDVLYVALFESPENEWHKYQPVAELMLSSIVYDPRNR